MEEGVAVMEEAVLAVDMGASAGMGEVLAVAIGEDTEEVLVAIIGEDMVGIGEDFVDFMVTHIMDMVLVLGMATVLALVILTIPITHQRL
jgi:hypothetical protein